ncbi:MAG TPA: type III-B CRISPR module RAMP protein Cmr6 [Saprospiraceae bacterium]|nr:type III-B CRISPR module RAMP protein Cmr6 [Saprospiraceae bacterium]
MANLSYSFYKEYYKGFLFWSDIKTKDERIKKEIETYFNDKNKVFQDFRVDPNEKSQIEVSHSLEFKTTYPGLLMGTGYTHGIGAVGEFKIGFHFDYTTGLPIIPGSSVKGLIRSAFPDFKKDKIVLEDQSKYTDFAGKINHVKACWILALLNAIDEKDFLKSYVQPLDIKEGNLSDEQLSLLNSLIKDIFEGVADSQATLPEDKYYSIYQRDIFHDAIPVRSEHTNNRVLDTDSITPHGDNPLKNPTPLLFLKVLPNVVYKFNFELKDRESISKDKKSLLLQKILLTLGIGAKTNVGYGQLEEVRVPKQIKPRSLQNELPKALNAQNANSIKNSVGQIVAIDGEFALAEFTIFDEKKLKVVKKIEGFFTTNQRKNKEINLNVGDSITIVECKYVNDHIEFIIRKIKNQLSL